MKEELQKIEALLFLAGEAVELAELARLVEEDEATTRELVAELTEEIRDHGLALTITDTHVQLTTSPSVAQYLKQYLAEEAQSLSAAAAETLALIAYRGPVTRPEIDAIRGVDSRRMVRQLASRGLVRKAKEGGRVAQYVITEEFLMRLGVTTAAELPRYEELSNHEKIQQLLDSAEE